jgi:hypothetical protein
MYSIFCKFGLERNLNPKAACLKRREEEKSEEQQQQQTGRALVIPPHDISHHLTTVRNFTFDK